MKTKKSGDKGKSADPMSKVVVSERMRLEMLGIAIRNTDAFLTIRERLDASTMRRVSQSYAAIWQAVGEYYDANDALPDRSILTAEVSRVLEDEYFTLTPAQEDQLADLLDAMFDDTAYKKPVETSREHAKWAVETAQKLLIQLAAEEIKEKLDDPHTLVEMPTMLQAMTEQVGAIQSMSASRSGELFATGWDVIEQKPLFSTGLKIIDEFIGGMRSAEVYGVFGPYGSCKTTLAVQAVVAGADQCANLWEAALAAYTTALAAWKAAKTGPKPRRPKRPMVVYASYETPVGEFRERCLAVSANVPRSELIKMDHRGVKSLRGPTDEPKPYEKEFYAGHIAEKIPFPCEQARVMANAARLNKYVVFLDMTGKTEERQQKGKGAVPELALELRFEMKERNAKLYCLWLDHAASMCEEYMIAKETDAADRRVILRRIPKQLGTLIAGPLDAPVFVLQQLSGEANSRKTTADIHHTDSDECKSFAMYLDFAITTTRPNAEQVCIFRCTKHRRTPPLPHKFIRVVGDYNRVEDVSNFYTLEGGGLGIVSKSTANAVQTAEEADAAIDPTDKPAKTKKKGKEAFDVHM